MVVAEIVLSAFVTVVFEKLATSDLMKLARSEGVHSQLKIWESKLSLIRAVLVDAGQKQITDRAVQLWLDDLQDLAYDIDDILDDLATEALRRKLTEESRANTSSKVQKLIPTCCTSFTPRTFTYGRKMSSKLDEITARLNDLLERKNSFGLNENVERPIKISSRRLETSLVESGVVGREGDKEGLLKRLLENETCNRNFSVVPIVGMGGIGKTTLARLLYNEKKVKDHFELKAWVCVSDEFDVFMISKIIFQALTRESRDFPDLNLLQEALQDRLSKKRFLLVLDDVWNEDGQSWERLQRPFLAGALGSKIILTTRSREVVSTMGRDQPYFLETLSSDESLSLFAQHALGERNFNKHPTLKPYGEGIVRRCKGLPLALITLGRALSTTVNEEEWEELMNNEIWSLQENKNEILPALRLSYHYLPQQLKQIFAYCSLFPKDYIFDKDELVLLWMAEGFLHESSGKRPMERVGFRYFEELLSRSFFQHSPNEESRYVMHDLMNDLATWVAGQFFYRLDDKKNGDERNEALEKIHYFSFVRQKYGIYRKFKAFQRAKRLRTFLPMSVSVGRWQEFYISNKVLIELLPQLQFLRVLSLSRYSIEEVPKSIGNLKHLRYLNFSHTRVRCLPEQVGDLYNLQTLLLCGCRYLTKLPNSFGKLVNLRHLDINDTPQLERMPLGIGGLRSLQTLSKVIIEETDGFKIAELNGLSELCGRFLMKGLDRVKTASHAKETNLVGKKSLDDLEMEWSNVFADSRKGKTEFEVLEALRPHDKLKKLGIMYYGGIKFPSWVREPSFGALTHLTLVGCTSCTSLPSLGHLPLLRYLYVRGMDSVKLVGPEFYGTGNSLCSIAFPSLEILEFSDMEGWERWLTNGSNNDVAFPSLRKLKIDGCPKLVEVSIQPVPSVQVLKIRDCSECVLRSLVQVASLVTKLGIASVVGLTQIGRGVLEFLRAVEELYVWNCNELRFLWASEAEACKILVNLRKLEVRDCEELVSLGEKEEVNQGNRLTSLRKLKFECCRRLECFHIESIEVNDTDEGIFPYLERLVIKSCSRMKWFPTGQKKLPSTLKSLEVRNCENLLLLESGGEKSSPLLNSVSSLESVSIYMWPNLKSFPELGRFIHLIFLQINDCEGIEYFPEEGCFLPRRLHYLIIGNCKNLKSFPAEQLQSLTSLVEMHIYNCPSLNSAFPSGLWPPNLSELAIGGLKKPMLEWGPQNYPASLVHLTLLDESSLVSFAEPVEMLLLLLLPSTLTHLCLRNCENLESLSKGLQHLTSLEKLNIWDCPKLRDLPDTLLPELARLGIGDCPELKERCISSNSNRRDSYWPLISHIPCLRI